MTGSSLTVRVANLTLGRPGREEAVLEGLDLVLSKGECAFVGGPTGSGKSSLLRALAGLSGVEHRGGRIERESSVALLAQHVETQLLCATVGEEIRLGLELLDLTESEMRRRSTEALEAVELSGYIHREVDRLSAGEKQRTVLAALLALEPELLLLDEPTSALDGPGRCALRHALGALKRRGAAILIADHTSVDLEPVVDRRYVIEKRTLVERDGSQAEMEVLPRPGGATHRDGAHPACRSRDDAAWAAGRLSPGREPDATGASDASLLIPGLPIRAGERVLVTGPNGAGKSTWLRGVARMAEGGAAARPGASSLEPGDVAFVIQEPRRALFARTVADEVAFTLQRRGWSAARVAARVEALLSRFELLDRGDHSPLRLSFGQQHRLAIAAALAAGPSLALLDEPFAGLDGAGRRALLDILDTEQRSSGMALVIASHDRTPLEGFCHRVIDLGDGGEALV